MLIRLLGLVAVGRDETLLQPVQGQVKSAVLAVLAKSEGRIVTVDTLIDAVWEAAPRSARNSVQVAVSQLRQMIGSDLIQGDRIGYTLRTGLLRVDLQEVEQLITDANQLIAVADWRAVEKTSARGLKFFDGTPLPGVRAPIAESLRQWASERRFGLLMTHARSLVELGRTAEAVTELGELATAHSLDDAIHRLLLRALALDGHPAAALDVYERFRRRLREELGTDPAPETDAEFQRLLKQEWTAPAAADVSTLIRSSAPVCGVVGRVGPLRWSVVMMTSHI